MKILFSARPSYGHVYPLMPLAEAAQRSGHQVSFATAGAFLPKLRSMGFPTHDVGIAIQDGLDILLESGPGAMMPRNGDGRPDADMGGKLFIEVLAWHTAADLAPVVATLKPDLVAYEQYDLGAGVAAHMAGIPAVCHSVSPRLPDAVLDGYASERVDKLWAEVGAEQGSFDVFTGDAYVDIVPTALQ